MKDMLLAALYRLARMIASDVLAEVVRLVNQAERDFPREGAGADKKKWLTDTLRTERAWAKSYLKTLPPVVSSAVLDVIVAWVKAGGGQ